VFHAERIYVLSLGSRQGNSHVHFHVVPLPKGVPYERQQYHAVMAEHGVLTIPDDEMAAMARRIGGIYAAID
jgi:histidine triad (HIT) family protein